MNRAGVSSLLFAAKIITKNMQGLENLALQLNFVKTT